MTVMDGREFAAVAATVAAPQAELAELRELTWDCLALLVGWAMMLNEMGGDDPHDVKAFPMSQVTPLLERARGLGVEP